MTLDGQEIADFSTRASGNRFQAIYHETTQTECKRHAAINDSERTAGQMVEVGEFSRFDLHEACWNYIHSSIGDSLMSANPLIQSLAVLDARVGVKRLNRVLESQPHLLTERLVRFRMREEKTRKAIKRERKAVRKEA